MFSYIYRGIMVWRTYMVATACCVMTLLVAGMALADDHGNADQGHAASKPKIIFHVGPVVKTPDPPKTGQQGTKGKDGGTKSDHH